MILFDSNVWNDYFRGTVTPRTEKPDNLLGRQPLSIGDLADLLHSDRDFDPFAKHCCLRTLV